MAGTNQTTHRFGSPPDPAEVETLDELAVGLRRLRAWSGLSFRDLHRRLAALRQSRGVVEIPTLTTIHRSMQPGRRRLDLELVTDIASVLLGDAQFGRAVASRLPTGHERGHRCECGGGRRPIPRARRAGRTGGRAGRPARAAQLGSSRRPGDCGGHGGRRQDNEAALRHAEHALALAIEAGVTTGLARALSLRGAAQAELGALADAAESVQAAIAAVPHGADPTTRRTSEGNLAWIRCLQGDYRAALEIFEPLLVEHQRSGDKTHVALVLNILGEVYARLGDNRQAVASHRRAIVLAAQIGYPDCETEACNDLASLLRRLGHPEVARGLHRRALGVAEALGLGYQRARAHEGLAEIAFDAGDRSEAIACWQRSLEEYRELCVPEADRLAERLRDLGVATDAS